MSLIKFIISIKKKIAVGIVLTAIFLYNLFMLLNKNTPTIIHQVIP